MELETLIRETLREHAADAPTRVPDVAAPPRRWLYAGLAAALVAGLAGGAVALRPSHGGDAPSSPAIPAAPLVPAGYKPISYHGITLAVPAELQVVTTIGCGAPNNSYVLTLDPNFFGMCPAVPSGPQRKPAISVEPDTGSVDRGFTLRHGRTIDGHATRTGGDDAVVLVAGLAIQLSGVPAVERHVVANSIHVTPTDWRGCPAANPTPDAQRGSSLVPRSPVSAAVCSYTGDGSGHATTQWLLGSRVLSASDRSALVKYIDVLPHRPLSAGAFPAQPPALLVVLRYADGSTFRLAAGTYSSLDWFVMNGDSFADDPEDGRISQLVGGVR